MENPLKHGWRNLHLISPCLQRRPQKSRHSIPWNEVYTWFLGDFHGFSHIFPYFSHEKHRVYWIFPYFFPGNRPFFASQKTALRRALQRAFLGQLGRQALQIHVQLRNWKFHMAPKMGKYQGKSWENHGKIMGKSCENHGKIHYKWNLTIIHRIQ